MKNRSILFAVILGFLLLVSKKEIQAGESHATLHGKKMAEHFVPNKTLVVANPGPGQDIQPSVEQALEEAVAGDQILLPEGVFEVRKTILINKALFITGAGLSKTILFRPESLSDALLETDSMNSVFKCEVPQPGKSNIVFSGICLKSKHPCNQTGDGGSLAADIGIKFLHCLDFVVQQCRFENFGYAAVWIQHEDSLARGLISKNQFAHNVKGPTGLGLGYGVVVFGSNERWVTDPQFGSANFIFIEDNSFEVHRHAVSAGGCGRYVFRFNTVTENNIGAGSAQAIDAHEARMVKGLNNYSTRAVEIYNNKVINTTFKDGKAIVPGQSSKMLVENAILIRGGEALIHDNAVQGYRFAIGIVNFEVHGNQVYPLFTQIGYLSGLAYGASHAGTGSGYGDGDLFAWNNTFTPYAGTDSSVLFYNYQPQYFKLERDYHFVAKPFYQTYIYPHPLAGVMAGKGNER